MPEPVDRVNQNPERRGSQPFRPHRPALERRMRPVEGIDRAGGEPFGQGIDDAFRPAIQSVGTALGMRRKCRPHVGSRIADHDERPLAQPVIRRERKTATRDQAMRPKRGGELIDFEI